MERFLVEAIESVLSQTFDDFEFIIADFGSTDKSKEIVSRFAARDVRIKPLEIPSCNLIEARTAACLLARGSHIAVMDADDVSLPNRFKWQVDFMKQHPEVAVLGGAAEWINTKGDLLWVQRLPTDASEINAALLSHFPFCHSAILMRKAAFDHVGGYRAVFTQSHDYDLCLRLSEQFLCANLKQPVVRYRIHPYQVSMEHRNKQTLCKLAAQVSASSRKTGQPDPFDAIAEITPTVLAELGVNYAEQQNDCFKDCQNWIRNMLAAGEGEGALMATVEALRSDWRYVGRKKIANLQLDAARLYWQQRRFPNGISALCKGLIIQPAVAGRLGRAMLRRIGQPHPAVGRNYDARESRNQGEL